jgi:hypothetical protein
MTYTDRQEVSPDLWGLYYGYGSLDRFFLVPQKPCDDDWERVTTDWVYKRDGRIVLDDDAFTEYGCGVPLWDLLDYLDTDKLFSLATGKYIFRPEAVVSSGAVDKPFLRAENRSKGGKKRAWVYRNDDFEDLFKVERRTLRKWENEGELDRSSLFSICMCFARKVLRYK